MDDQSHSIASEQPGSSDVNETAPIELSYSSYRSEGTSFADEPGVEPEEGRPKASKDGPSSSQPLAATKDTRLGRVGDWTSEIVAMLLAICCLAAIFIILAKFNNQEQPNWPHASTLNLSTLIALIATILRSMLENVIDSGIGQLKWRWFQSSSRPLSHMQTFDYASRGSWGSFIFMFTLARPNLATLGAIITVSSVVIGTFTQEAIQTVSCQRPSSNGQASIPVAQTSLRGLQVTSGSDPGYELTIDLRASIIAGLAGSQSPNSLSPTCTSGNCTFQATAGITYSTAGFSSECIDISSLITQGGLRSWESHNNYSVDTATNYSLPNGLAVNYFLLEQNWASTGGRWDTMLAKTDAFFSANGTLSLDNVTMTQRQRQIVNNASFDGIVFLMPATNPCQDPSGYQTNLGNSEMLAMPPVKANLCPQLDLPGVDTLPGYFSVTAAACYFYASLQHYNGSIVNGKLQEEAVQDPTPLDYPDTGELCDWRCGFADPCIVDHVVYTNTSANLSSVPGGLTSLGNTTGPTRCLYGFSYVWYRALLVQTALWEIIGNSGATETCEQFGNYTAMICPKTWWLSDIFNGGNASISHISAFMNRGLDSLTDQLRTIGTDWNNSLSTLSGTVYETDVCTQFRWVWLIYPLVMVIGTIVLLLSVVISSSGLLGFRREVIWKSSVLPFLFYGLQDERRKVDSGLAPQGELSGAARAVNVRFSSGDDGWRLHTP